MTSLLQVGLGVLLACAAGCTRGDPRTSMHHGRTSVLWLTLCTLRADHVGAYGYERDVSPFIDSLAEGGVLFEHALTTAPWTRAAIAASITGLYPRTLDIEEPSTRASNRRLLDSFRTIAEALRDQGYYTIGITANPNTHAVFNFDQGFDYYEDTGRYLWRTGYRRVKRTAEEVGASLLERLQALPEGQRFFAHLTYVDVHGPLLDRVVAGRFEALAAVVGDGYSGRYDMQLRYLDSAIETLLADLHAMGYEDLLVIITSDHGEAFGALHGGDSEHGRTLYNETIWVPLIFSHPSLQRVSGRRSARVDTASIMATVLDLLAIDHEPVAGGAESLKDLVLDQSRQARSDASVVETCFMDANRSAVVSDDWKLIATYEPGDDRRGEPDAVGYELYRVGRDWAEADDLAARMPEQVGRLAALLGRWQAAHDPEAAAADLEVVVPDRVLENLRVLGYVE